MKLYKHQERALDLLADHNAFALFMEQGTGKTIPALIHVTNLLIAGDIENCLIVAPLSTLGSWKRDLDKLSPLRQRLASKITLINYDKVWRREEYQRDWDCRLPTQNCGQPPPPRGAQNTQGWVSRAQGSLKGPQSSFRWSVQ